MLNQQERISPTSVDDLFQQAAKKVDDKIVIDQKIYGGAPCVANTRVPVYAILEMVEAGCARKKILNALNVDNEGLKAALRFAAFVLER